MEYLKIKIIIKINGVIEMKTKTVNGKIYNISPMIYFILIVIILSRNLCNFINISFCNGNFICLLAEYIKKTRINLNGFV